MSTTTALPTTEALSVSALHADPSLIRKGMGVTMRTNAGGLYSPFTVIETRRNGRELVIQRDKTVVTGEKRFADDGERHYETDPNGRTETITLRKDGSFIVKGVPMEWYSTRYSVGYRRDWVDYSV